MKPLPLRISGPLVEPFRKACSESTDPPRALRSLARIVEEGLCHRCGSCVGICPTAVLGLDRDEYPVVENLSACTDCDLCVRVCPGLDFSAEVHAEQLFDAVPDRRDMHGHFVTASLVNSTDPLLREQTSSGGGVTAVLLDLLERKVIDGAIVVGSDDEELWKGRPLMARTREELLGSTKSKYAIAPTNVVLAEVRKTPGRYAVVGLPCQIHGLLKAASLDRRISERVVLTIGLFCHAAVEHDPMRFIFDNIGEIKNRATKFISRVGKHPGTPHLELDDGSLYPVYFPKARVFRPTSMEVINMLYRMYTPPRCLTCYDSTAEFADIAAGDPWMAPPADDINFFDGYTFMFARTKRGESILADVEGSGSIKRSLLPADTARTCNVSMGEEKRWRAFRIIETQKRRGQAVPDYGFQIPCLRGLQFIKAELNMLSHVLCFLPRFREPALRLLFSPIGYGLLWFNNKRRRFREWRRDTLARRKRHAARR